MKERMARRWRSGVAALAALCAAAVMVACGGSGGDTGTLRVALTDAPACGYDHVYVTVEKVRVHRSSGAGENDAGWAEMVLDPPKRVDLLELTNGVLSELGEMPLETGRYTQMRLVLAQNTGAEPLANSVVPTGGTEVALKTPSGQQSGVKMKVNIDVQPDQLADVVIDMDGCRSVVVVDTGNSGQRLLKPVVRVVPRLLTGVAGHVEAALAGTTRVSLQQGGATVRSTVPDATGRFLLQPVDEGIYDLVVTAAGRATTVVTGIAVVGDAVVPVNTAANAFAPPTSATATASGTVEPAADAEVRVTQELSSGTTIEVAGGPAGESGAYAHVVPVAGPSVAAWGGATLAFSTDTGAAGKYTLEAMSGEAVQTEGPKTFAAGATVTTNFTFP